MPGISLVSVSPATATQGQTLSVTITGANTHFSQATNTTISFSQGTNTIIKSGTITKINDTSLKADFSIPANTPIGNYDLNLNNYLDGSISLLNGFQVMPLSGLPDLQLTSTTLTGLNYNYGSGPSAEQTFTVSGSSLSGNVVITPTSRLEISKTTGAGFASSAISLSPTSGSVSTTTIYVRLKSGLTAGSYTDTLNIASTGVLTKKIISSGTVSSTPQLTTSATNLTGLNYNYGSGPSAEQTFTVSGSSLSGNVVITPTSRLEISKTTGAGFASTAINLAPTSGSVSTTTIYVRLKSGLTAGSYSDTLNIASTGTITKKIIVSGTVSSTPQLTTSATTLTGLNYNYGSGPSAEQTFTVSGSSLSGNVVITPTSRLEISKTTGTGFASAAISLTPTSGSVSNTTIYVRLKSGLIAGSYADTLRITSTGASSKYVYCSATVLNPISTRFISEIYLNRAKFTNNSTGSIDSYKWDFGDGTTSTETNPYHVYSLPGTYTIKLKGIAGLLSDSIQSQITISNQSTWIAGGNYSLDKTKTGVKNFTDATNLFTTFSQTTITSDISVQTASSQQFDIPITTDLNQTLNVLVQKLQSNNHKINFVSDSLSTKPVLNFIGELNQSFLNCLLSFGKYLSVQNVLIAINGIPFDITKITDFKPQVVCSGTNTTKTDFTALSPQIPVSWSLSKLPASITGYITTGTQVIPQMTLTNTSDVTDTLTYNIQLVVGSTPLYVGQLYYLVLPQLKGVITDLVPTNNKTLSTTTVDFSWKSIPNAVYDLYLWESNAAVVPSIPTVGNLSNFRYTNSSFCQYGKSYKWKVVARGTCNSIVSETDSFKIRSLPNLQVSSIQILSPFVANRKISINATVVNSGEADSIARSWEDRFYISKDTVFNKSNATLLSVINHYQNLKKNDLYTDNFNFVALSDTLKHYRFFVETDAQNTVLETSDNDNIINSNWISFAADTMEVQDFKILNSFFTSHSGLSWKQKWNTTSNRISSTNWQGVSFEDGHVTAISLPSNQIQGGMPLVLFTLPKLRDLNLYDNLLTSKIDSTIANVALINSFKTDSLVSINLSKNLLEGEIPSIFRKFTHLKTLNLQANKLSALSTPLPLNITSLYLQNQTINVDSIKLALTPTIQIPTLSLYNHSTQSFDFHPYFSVINNGAVVGSVYFNGSKNQLYISNSTGWMFDSGQRFVLRQENGLASGTSLLSGIFFDYGDANMDQKVDILDVQHSLNYLLGDNPQPFNFAAADTYKDTLITVQDIVKTVNIVLSSTDSTSTNLQKSKMAVQSPNQIYIENNKLVLDITQPVSAMDILLEGISDKQIRLMLSSSKFQLIARNLPDGGTRFIVFSPTGNEIPTGKTIIAELYSESPTVTSVKLSDKSAQPMLVRLNKDNVTGFENLVAVDFSVYCIAHKSYVSLSSNVQKLRATLYSAQGIMLDDRIMENLASGKLTIDYSSVATKSGVYLLKIVVNTNDGIRELNTKLIISK